MIALGAAVSGDVRAGLRECDRAALALDGLSDTELATSLEAGIWLGWAELFLERLPDSLRHLERCLTIARRGAHQHVLPHLLIGYGSALKNVGRLVEAAEVFDEAAEAASRTGQSRAGDHDGDDAVPGGDLARGPAAGRGAGQPGGAGGRRAGTTGSPRWPPRRSPRPGSPRAAPQGCVDAILDAGGGAELPRFDPASRCDWWEVATRAALLDGDARPGPRPGRRGRSSARRPCCCTHPPPTPSWPPPRCCWRAGTRPAAAERARSAAEAFSGAGFVLDRARAQLLAGPRAARRPGSGGRRWRRCTRRRTASPAAAPAACWPQARVELRRLGRRLPTAAAARQGQDPAAGPLAVLSPRERQVAALVALGRTNRQIAAELVVSEKTVESHLGHIFTKLGLSSRAGLAGLAAPAAPDDRPLTGPPRLSGISPMPRPGAAARLYPSGQRGRLANRGDTGWARSRAAAGSTSRRRSTMRSSHALDCGVTPAAQ